MKQTIIRLAIITTHPIQYNAPWFKLLADKNRIDLKVFYTWSQSKNKVKDKTFKMDIKWDIPLLEGYNYEFIENTSKHPGSHHFFGIDNPDLIRKISDFSPQYILIFGWNFKSHFKAMRYFRGKIPVWFRGDSTLIDEKPGVKMILRRLLLSWIYSYVDKALYVGSANKSYFLAHGIKNDDLINVPHAIDVERFLDSNNIYNYQTKVKEKQKELGLSGRKVVVFAGKLEEKKQPKQLLEAISRINERNSETIHLLVVGSGPQEKELKEMASGKSYVTFLPFQNQTMMPIIYRLADVFCLPSKGPGETWGLAVNEAMASLTPVVVSNKVGSSFDLIIEGGNGFIIDSNSVESLIRGLNLAINLKTPAIIENCSKINDHWNFNTVVSVLETELIQHADQ